jgi:hypothetical protein
MIRKNLEDKPTKPFIFCGLFDANALITECIGKLFFAGSYAGNQTFFIHPL